MKTFKEQAEKLQDYKYVAAWQLRINIFLSRVAERLDAIPADHIASGTDRPPVINPADINSKTPGTPDSEPVTPIESGDHPDPATADALDKLCELRLLSYEAFREGAARVLSGNAATAPSSTMEEAAKQIAGDLLQQRLCSTGHAPWIAHRIISFAAAQCRERDEEIERWKSGRKAMEKQIDNAYAQGNTAVSLLMKENERLKAELAQPNKAVEQLEKICDWLAAHPVKGDPMGYICDMAIWRFERWKEQSAEIERIKAEAERWFKQSKNNQDLFYAVRDEVERLNAELAAAKAPPAEPPKVEVGKKYKEPGFDKVKWWMTISGDVMCEVNSDGKPFPASRYQDPAVFAAAAASGELVPEEQP